MTILGIDPGSAETAYTIIDGDYNILASDKLPNAMLMVLLPQMEVSQVAIESIQSYGMAVGREVFDTCFMIGRLQQKLEDMGKPVTLYPRPEYTRRLCGVGKVNDAVLRQALLLRFGGDKKGEPLSLLKGASDKRSAFAVAVYHLDGMPLRREPF